MQSARFERCHGAFLHDDLPLGGTLPDREIVPYCFSGEGAGGDSEVLDNAIDLIASHVDPHCLPDLDLSKTDL